MSKGTKIKNFIKKNLLLYEIIGVSLLFILGIGSIIISTIINPDISNNDYWFEVTLYLEDETIQRKLNFFSWEHNFSEDNGEISFVINFNEKIKELRIDFPSYIENSSLMINLYKCESIVPDKCSLNDKKFDIDLVENLSHSNEAIIFLSEFPENLRSSLLKINYNSHIEPNGLFNIMNGEELLNSGGNPAISFNVGNKYGCIEGCLIKDEMRGIKIHRYNDDKNIRLIFPHENEDDDVRPLRFKLQTYDSYKLFYKNLSNGIGISLFVSSIILSFQFIRDWIKIGNKRKYEKRK